MRTHLTALLATLTLLLGAASVPAGAAVSKPRWPKKNCDTHSMMFIDYTPDAQGAATRHQAAKPYMRDADTLVKQVRHHHRPTRWLVVRPNDRIRVVLTIFKGENGYLVDSVERCSR